ncbi:hypothetical protein BJ546DRAFT_928732 [Cryomyces antarcticus]|uniref:Uncharacterized protein n=1 Tax=Cryomyces antarcticus TaxID=329879 RepID=A0ABR0LR61_9PEZI|nr:hypothetical protein LTR39_000163 [Cryomyces antarcticus]KAK5021257.1 hypothetical protein LTR60_000055 [Cryomyces antarcticus]KAK5165664.1 hypothetical protein LTR04_001046 [Oleoguttula sp. CCFEE 6159]KAK5202138.1 hypothetical protein LTR16_000271 [Cryomyces antarcticus]
MSPTPIPRFLLPRGSIYLRDAATRQAVARFIAAPSRNASSAQPSKPLVLEKPARFNPPSHASRLRTKPRAYPGPALSEEVRQEQKTKKYPNMMPPEGSFMHSFLTNKLLHTWITLGTLFSLAGFVFVKNFTTTTVYKDMLPENREFYSHPFRFLRTYFEVYKLQVAYTSAETADRRRRKVEDVQKRNEYRKAHGLDQSQGLGGWTAKTDAENIGPALNTDGAVTAVAPAAVAEAASREGGQETYTDFVGRKKPIKKWLGIW